MDTTQIDLDHPPPRIPIDHRHGINYEYGLFWPRDASTWPRFASLLLFTGDGIFTVAVLCFVLLALYRTFGRPLEQHAADRHIERSETWNAHGRRFERRMPDGRMRSTGAGWSRAPSVDGSDIVEKREAIRVKPIKVETVIVRLSGDGDDDCQDEARTVRVEVVGEREGSTLSVVTHHDCGCNFRHGLLPLSVEIMTSLDQDRFVIKNRNPKISKAYGDSAIPTPMRSFRHLTGSPAAEVHTSAEQVCFYHISAPGHAGPSVFGSEGPEEVQEHDDWREYVDGKGGPSGWSMDALAGRMNKIVSCLGITGRTVYLGEGAGSNICLRAAAETAQRSLRSSAGSGPGCVSHSCPGFFVSGVALVSPECGGPTVGNALTSGIASAILRRGFRSKSFPLGLIGVTPAVLASGREGGILDIVDELDGRCLATYTDAYYSPGMRSRLCRGSQRMAALHNVPNVVICSERSIEGKVRAEEVCNVLDATQGSGVVEVQTMEETGIGGRYVAGGGAVLYDCAGRKACANIIRLFFEAL